uniref:thioredoxin-dependent peroxiredoxin n=1 Tax=Capra hircus TaxID=9925 RepID=A0A452EGA7_CAPHI
MSSGNAEIGHRAPQFKAIVVVPDGRFNDISLSDYREKYITTSDLPVGDSVDETLRLVQAFQFIDTHGKVCPAGWKPGSNTIKSDVQKSKEYFSKWPWAILGPGCNRRP